MSDARHTRLAPEVRSPQLLAVATRLFSEHGYDGVSVEAVARAAGVTRGLIHHYYGGKRELYLTVLAALSDSALHALDDQAGGAEVARVRETMDVWMDWLHPNRALWLAIVPAEQPDPGVSRTVETAREAIVARLIELHSPGTGKQSRLRFAVLSWTGLADAACREWLQDRATGAETRELLAASLWHILETYGRPRR